MLWGVISMMGHYQKPITPLGDLNNKRYPNGLCYNVKHDCSGGQVKFGFIKHVW
jgi:hypothetical protein